MKFRKMLLLPAAGLLLTASVASAAPASLPPDGGITMFITPVTASIQDPPPKADVTIQVENTRDVWYLDPLWITVGLVAAGLVIALIVAASRSGGSGPTTVVK
ncbi:MAG: hypothetical protein ACT4OZ_01420 [Gemmatimonadota bacterium]